MGRHNVLFGDIPVGSIVSLGAETVHAYAVSIPDIEHFPRKRRLLTFVGHKTFHPIRGRKDLSLSYNCIDQDGIHYSIPGGFCVSIKDVYQRRRMGQ